MASYDVLHQDDFIIVPRKDVVFHQSGTEHRVYIKVRDMESLNKIIEQCENIRLNMWKEKINNDGFFEE